MDAKRLDQIAKTLSAAGSRRAALGLLVGVAGLGLGEVAAKRRKRGKGKGQGRVRSQAADQAHQIALCHYDREADAYSRISVSNNGDAVAQHLANHVSDDGAEGDFLVGDAGCCNDGDCTGADESCVIAVDADGTRSGSCTAPCTPQSCTHGQVCSNGSCVCAPTPPVCCNPLAPAPRLTTEGCTACFVRLPCGSFPGCASSADCQPNEACLATHSCTGAINGVCIPLCPAA